MSSPVPHQATKSSTRDDYLDGMRGLGSSTVVVFHSISAIAPVIPGAVVLPWSFLWVMSTWGPGVLDIFFVLSGFFITRLLLAHADSSTYFRTFWLRRAARILPAAFAVLFLLGLVFAPRDNPGGAAYTGGRDVPMWPLWTLTTNLVQLTGQGFGFFEHYWSIALEEQFYLLWPFAVRFLRRRTLERLCLGLIVFGPVFRFAAAVSPVASYPLIENQLFSRCDGFAAGALIVLLEARGRQLPWRQILAVGAVLMVAVLPEGGIWVHYPPTGWWSSVGHTGLVLFAVALVAGREELRPRLAGRVLTHPISVAYGHWSYALYLVHFPIAHVLAKRVAPFAPPSGIMFVAFWTAFVFAILLVSGAAAAVLHHAVERPALKLYRFFPFGPPVADADAGALRRAS